MEHIIKQLKKGAKHTRLSAVEKAEMKSTLLRHVKANPVRIENLVRRQFVDGNKSLLSPFQINNLRSKKSTMPILVMLGLLMGGSASFAAENTVPGDILYPVKVHVNEAVRGAVAVTPKAKAEWEVRLVERRLEEVEKLATTPNALPEVQQIAQTNLAEYTSRVKEHIAKFDEENDSEDALATAGNLADMLRTHEGMLAGLSTQVAAVATSTPAIAGTATSSIASVAATSTTTTAVTSAANTQSLASVLAQLHTDRSEAEKKHNDLEHKYHPEAQKVNEDKNDNGSDESSEVVSVNPAPVLVPVVSTASGTTTITTTAGTSTPAVQTVIPAVQSLIHENIPSRNEHEEIRATPGATLAAPATVSPIVAPATTERTEARTESSKTRDND